MAFSLSDPLREGDAIDLRERRVAGTVASSVVDMAAVWRYATSKSACAHAMRGYRESIYRMFVAASRWGRETGQGKAGSSLFTWTSSVIG